MNKTLENIKAACKTKAQRKAFNELVKTFASAPTKPVNLTDSEISWLLMTLSTCKTIARRNSGTVITRYDLEGELSSLYKKLFDASSDDIKSDSDFGNGKLLNSGCSIFG